MLAIIVATMLVSELNSGNVVLAAPNSDQPNQKQNNQNNGKQNNNNNQKNRNDQNKGNQNKEGSDQKSENNNQDKNNLNNNQDKNNNKNGNIQFSANPQLANAQKEFTMLQNQIDFHQEQYQQNKERIRELQSKLTDSKNRKDELDKQYLKLVHTYQDQNDNQFLDWLFSILPFLKPGNYDDDAKKQVLKSNRDLSDKLNQTQDIIRNQETSLTDQQNQQKDLVKKLNTNKKKLSANIKDLQNQINSNVAGLTNDQINQLKKSGDDAVKGAELLQKDNTKAQKEILSDPDTAKEVASSASVDSPKANTDIGYVMTHDLRVPSGLSASQLANGLTGNEKPLASAYVKAEKTYGVNAVALAAISSLESGYASFNTFGTNNIFGYRGKSFATKEDSIYFVAKHLREDYLTASGQFYGGGYSIQAVSKFYNLGSQKWSNDVTTIAESIMANAR